MLHSMDTTDITHISARRLQSNNTHIHIDSRTLLQQHPRHTLIAWAQKHNGYNAHTLLPQIQAGDEIVTTCLMMVLVGVVGAGRL